MGDSGGHSPPCYRLLILSGFTLTSMVEKLLGAAIVIDLKCQAFGRHFNRLFNCGNYEERKARSRGRLALDRGKHTDCSAAGVAHHI